MKRFFNRQDMIMSLIFALIGAAAGFVLVTLQWNQMDEAMKSAVIAQLGTRTGVIAVSTMQVAILAFITSFLGVKLARKTNLELKWIPAVKAWIPIAAIALAAALIITLSDKLIFAAYLPGAEQGYSFSLLYLVSSVLYGGIIEEVLMRLFLMSLLVLLLGKMTRRSNETEIPGWVYIVSIFISALLFAAGHLPATSQLLGLSPMIVLRAITLNGLAAIGFGWLYWKHGLGSAMGAHILTHLLMQLILMPVLA